LNVVETRGDDFGDLAALFAACCIAIAAPAKPYFLRVEDLRVEERRFEARRDFFGEDLRALRFLWCIVQYPCLDEGLATFLHFVPSSHLHLHLQTFDADFLDLDLAILLYYFIIYFILMILLKYKMNANAPSFSPISYDNSAQKYIEKNTIIPMRKDENNISFESDEYGKVKTHRYLTFDQFRNIPKGFGGRVGVLVYYIEDGQRHYVLNISNRQLYSDFGGGVKKKLSPYEGLKKELLDEVPQWVDLFMKKIEDNNNIIIYNQENLSTDDRNIRTETMFIFPIEKIILSAFRGTEEVRDLVVMNQDEFYDLLFNKVMMDEMGNTFQHLNNGLVMIRKMVWNGWLDL